MGHYPLAILKKNIWNANDVFACYLCHADLVSIQVNICLILVKNKCAKFCGLCAIIGLAHVVPLWHHAFVGILWVQNFSCGSFMGPKIFLLDVLWVEIFFLWVWRGSEIFSCRYYVGSNFFLTADHMIQRSWERMTAWERVTEKYFIY